MRRRLLTAIKQKRKHKSRTSGRQYWVTRKAANKQAGDYLKKHRALSWGSRIAWMHAVRLPPLLACLPRWNGIIFIWTPPNILRERERVIE
mmetsp:Transcript_61059/g.133681  ORF Transcript_61059/g.133681 Transcript_61059/m.133681 type:complete len:91 (-) Transcript_61059:1988-2260(-)